MKGYRTMIFSSLQFNADPEPFVWPESRRKHRLSDGPLRSMFAHGDGEPLSYDPRPEYDVPTFHPVNPILTELRWAVENWGDETPDGNGPFAFRFHRWLHYVIEQDLGFDYTAEHLDHARRVLTRLVALAGEPA